MTKTLLAKTLRFQFSSYHFNFDSGILVKKIELNNNSTRLFTQVRWVYQQSFFVKDIETGARFALTGNKAYRTKCFGKA
jgi:hypothetical protein